MPRAVVITKLDQARADYDGVLLAAQEAFGDKVMPLYLPVRTGDEVTASRRSALAVGARRRRAARHLHRGGHRGVRGRDPDGPLPRGRGDRRGRPGRRPREGRRPRRASTPSYPSARSPVSAATELLDLMVRAFPSPPRAPAARGLHAGRRGRGRRSSCDPDGPLVAEVVKTTSDPYVGRLSLVRVFSGTLVPDATVHVSGHFSSFFGDDGRPPRPRRGREDRRPVHRVRPAPRAGRPGGRRGHLPPSVGSPAPRPATPSPRSTTRGCSSRGRCPSRCCPVAIVARLEGRRRQALLGAVPAGRRGPLDPDREQRRDPPAGAVVHGRGARRRRARAARRAVLRPRRHGAVPGVAAGDLRRHRRRATAATSSSPAATGSTPCATSRSSRSRRAVGSSSSTRWSAASVPRNFIPSVEKGVRRQMERGVRAGYPSSTSGSPSPTARPTPWTPPTWPSRPPARWRCARPRTSSSSPAGALRRGHRGRSPTTSSAAVMSRPLVPPRPAARHRQGRRRPHPGARRGPPDRAHPLRHRPALVHPRLRHLHPRVRALRARCPRTSPAGSTCASTGCEPLRFDLVLAAGRSARR